jgi:Family of unknown function (DUF6308)
MRWVGQDAMTDAADRLVRYMQSDTGRFFDVFAMEGDPNRFEWSDIVAVACLSVNVPAAVVDWLLRGEGTEPTARMLSGVGDGQSDQNLAQWNPGADTDANKLWNLLRRQPGMGPTTTMKLMAAGKRDVEVPSTLYSSPASRWSHFLNRSSLDIVRLEFAGFIGLVG